MKDHYSGFKGKFITMLMNLFHLRVHRLLAEKLSSGYDESILDIGCGGGGLVKILSVMTDGAITGIDYSKSMVTAARKKNADGIMKSKVKILEASVSEMPFDENSFNKVTAFETVHFWPSLPDDLIEVKRVLKKGGSLHIMNRMPGEKSKWYDFVKFKDPNECRTTLEKAGYEDIVIDTELKKGWLYVRAIKHCNNSPGVNI